MKAAVLTTYGDPATGIECRDVPEPGKPGVGQVLVGVEFAPINFSDILVARGLYPLRPDLTSVIGNEGVGRVLETWIAADVVRIKDGSLVEHWDVIQDEAKRLSTGTWLKRFRQRNSGKTRTANFDGLRNNPEVTAARESREMRDEYTEAKGDVQ